jgi:hypothetical protein
VQAVRREVSAMLSERHHPKRIPNAFTSEGRTQLRPDQKNQIPWKVDLALSKSGSQGVTFTWTQLWDYLPTEWCAQSELHRADDCQIDGTLIAPLSDLLVSAGHGCDLKPDSRATHTARRVSLTKQQTPYLPPHGDTLPCGRGSNGRCDNAAGADHRHQAFSPRIICQSELGRRSLRTDDS